MVNQEQFPPIDTENLKTIETENASKADELKTAKERLKHVKTALGKFSKVKSPKELEFKANQLRVANRKLAEKVENAKSVANGVDSSSIESNMTK